MSSRLRRLTAVLALIAVSAAHDAGAQSQPPPAVTGLDEVYEPGAFLQDRNGDAVVDFLAAGVLLGASPSDDEVAAAANIAARFGFETMAMNLPIERDRQAGPVVAIGPAGLLRAGASLASLDPRPLAGGQGLVAITTANSRPVVAVTGGDAAGVRAAAAAFAARLPFVWVPKGATLHDVAAEVRAVIVEAGVKPSAVSPIGVRVEAGRDEFERVIVQVALASAADLSRVRTALAGVRSAPVAAAPAATPEADSPKPVLSYPGARALEIRLVASAVPAVNVVIDRAAAPAAPELPPVRRPGAGAKEAVDLSSLFAIDGLLGDSDSNLIPDRVDAVISATGEGTDGVIDLAARVGLESTGVSLPLVVTPGQLGKPESQPTLVLVGGSHPVAAELAKSGKLVRPPLQPGQGAIQVVRKAFGDKSAVVVSGADEPGVRRALQQMSERFPHIWQRGKDRTTLDTIENDVRRFIGGRTPAGQAATAVYKLDQMAAKLRGRALEAARVRVYLDKAEPGLESFLRTRLAPALPAGVLDVVIENLDVQKAKTLIDNTVTIASEVDEFWRRLRNEVIPKVRRRQPVVVEARLSEPPDVRARISREATAELIKAGASVEGTSVTVLSAYKQGYSWLYDVVRPALTGKAVAGLTIRFAETGPPEEWKQQAMFTPTRWLLELFPIDEILARELGLDLASIHLEKMPIGSPTYEVIATDAGGTELLRETFEPKMVLRPYFDKFPDYEKVRVTTGWITAKSRDRVLVDSRIITDLERFWDHFQGTALNRLYDYTMALTDGKPDPADAPFFGELTVDVSLSEPDYQLGLDKEQISSLNSLHEDVYFATLHFFDVLGRYARGGALNYPGRVIPIMRPKGDGTAGTATITLTGFGSVHPAVAIDYVEKGGATGTIEMEVPPVAVERPSAVAAVVTSGRDGIDALTLRLKVDTEQDEREALLVRAREDRVDRQIMSAAQAGALLAHLSALRAAGLYRDALAYHDLGDLHLITQWAYTVSAATETTVTLARGGVPAPWPDITTLLPAGYRHTGEPIVQWDTPIPPPEANQMLAKMASSFPQATAYQVGESYLGKNIWAMDLMSPITASHWSAAKATTWKPTVIYSARQHANEVSSTSHTLKLAELLLTDPAYRPMLDKVNVVFHPVTNPDGAQLAYDLYRITPDFMLHAGYLGALGVDVTNQQWEQDPIYPESPIRADLWRQWLPDVFLNPHGYPSHEWVMLFSEYAGWVRNRVTEARDWWGMRGWFTPGFGYLDDAKFPRHKEAAFEIRDRFSASVNAAPEVRALNTRAYARYERYGRAFDPENFKLDFTNDVLIYSAIKGAKASPTSQDFMTRNPNVTIWTGSTEAPDETAYGDWMKLVATAGLQWDKAILDYLATGDHQVERKTEEFFGGMSLSINRPRPPKPRDGSDPSTTTGPQGAQQE
ncbi:MAG: M14 family metallopeptidase [Vicinamibacterales bacterium]